MANAAYTDDDAPAPAGHNRPPALTPEELKADLEERYGALSKRVLDRRAGALTVKAVDADNVETVQDFIAQLTDDKREVEAARVKEKKPHDDRGNVVQAFFKPAIIDKLDGTIADLNKMKLDYQKKKAAEEKIEQQRKLAEAEAERKRLAAQEEAARKAAQDAMAAGDREAAKEALAQVDATNTARQNVEEDAARVARTVSTGAVRGAYGSSSLTDFWNFEIVDPLAMKPADLWPYIDQEAIDKAIRSLIKEKAPTTRDPAPTLAGVRIFVDQRSANRRS
ncbi:hypothetical protein [Thalassobaculum sp.]|uniref:hypothetical protein n=1 Tax=Thalassobaculum sp. TaxID=2022740 RepID=UPI0032F06F0C